MLFWMTLALARGADPDDPNHFHDVKSSAEDIAIGIEDAWARPDEAKAKIVVRNDTADFLVVRTDQMMFSAHGHAMAQDDVLIIAPRSKETKVLQFQGHDLKANGAWFSPGGVYRIPSDTPASAAPPFSLPVTQRGFQAGPFDCTVHGKVEQETDETVVRFRCTYDGVGLGLVDTSALSVKVEGQEFPNEEGNGRLRPILAGQNFKLKAVFEVPPRVADMQFAELEVQFNDAFREGVPSTLPEFEPMQLDVDWKKTN